MRKTTLLVLLGCEQCFNAFTKSAKALAKALRNVLSVKELSAANASMPAKSRQEQNSGYVIVDPVDDSCPGFSSIEALTAAKSFHTNDLANAFTNAFTILAKALKHCSQP